MTSSPCEHQAHSGVWPGAAVDPRPGRRSLVAMLHRTKTLPERALEGVTLLLCATALVWFGLLTAAGESLDDRPRALTLLRYAEMVWPVAQAGWSPLLLTHKVDRTRAARGRR
jgi:hypothetical protein